MGKEYEVQVEALSSLAREYKQYGQNISTQYKNRKTRIDSELGSILRKYSDYSSVTSKVYSLQSKLRDADKTIKELQDKASKISTGLKSAAQLYKETEQTAEKLIDEKIATVTIQTKNVKVTIEINKDIDLNVGKLTNEVEIISQDEIEAPSSLEKASDLFNKGIEAVTTTISGITKKVSDTVSDIADKVSDVVDNMKTKVTDFTKKVAQTTITVVDSVKNVITGLKDGITSFAKKTKDTLVEWGEKIGDAVDAIGGKIEEVATSIVDYVIEHKDEIIEGAKKVGTFILDGIQTVLDIVGLIPAAGEICDAINAGIYALRGDWVNAGLSLAACIPFAGWAATGGKIGNKIIKFVDKIGDVSKIIDKVKDLVKYIDEAKDLGKAILKYGDDVLQFITTKGDNIFSFITKKADDVWSFITNTKIYQKADEIVQFISKNAENITNKVHEFIGNAIEGLSEKFSKEIAEEAIENKVEKEIAEEVIGEINEEIVEEAIENKVEKEIAEEVIGEVNEEIVEEVIEDKVEKEVVEEAIGEVNEEIVEEVIEDKVEKEVAEETIGEVNEEIVEEVIEDKVEKEVVEETIGEVNEEIVEEDIENKVQEEVVEGNKYLSYDDFKKLTVDEQIELFSQMSSEEIYELVKNSQDSWVTEAYDLITPDNAKDFVKILENAKGEISFNLEWPKYGGYDPNTISSIDDLSGKVIVSRDGGDGGYTMGMGKNADGTFANNSQRSIPKSSAEVNTGTFDADLYKTTVDIVVGNGSELEKIKKLQELGISKKSATKMLSDYEAWLTRTEIIGLDNISDGVELSGRIVEAKYGYYGKVAEWNVGDVRMVGGAGQMNTVYSWGTLKEAGIISELGKANIN